MQSVNSTERDIRLQSSRTLGVYNLTQQGLGVTSAHCHFSLLSGTNPATRLKYRYFYVAGQVGLQDQDSCFFASYKSGQVNVGRSDRFCLLLLAS